ncbi:hypothetical protein [Calothrix sp. PCC 6303]|uniref:hypothetical protein n=1 Tax=Calothrix sp. PCC 6303 TaxID=1170562 RepID=UPI0002A04F72|nr:hypothetical protein [Calothrix sp. PCC 6303]AFZ00908.1 hypothetical protein Cal6303_1874 [Calothrix sp. PCC 6303]
MLQRFAITSGLILTNILIVTPATWAESTEVQIHFSGVVPERTSVRISPTPNSELLSSLKIIKSPQGQRSTTLHFDSTQPSNIIVSPPEFVSGSHPEPRGTVHTSLLKFEQDSSDTSGKNFTTIPAGKVDLQLQTLVKAPQDLPPGIYNYRATLTIVP